VPAIKTRVPWFVTCSQSTLYRDTRIGHKTCTWMAKTAPYSPRTVTAFWLKYPDRDRMLRRVTPTKLYRRAVISKPGCGIGSNLTWNNYLHNFNKNLIETIISVIKLFHGKLDRRLLIWHIYQLPSKGQQTRRMGYKVRWEPKGGTWVNFQRRYFDLLRWKSSWPPSGNT
jgi:hypothetical protein